MDVLTVQYDPIRFPIAENRLGCNTNLCKTRFDYLFYYDYFAFKRSSNVMFLEMAEYWQKPPATEWNLRAQMPNGRAGKVSPCRVKVHDSTAISTISRTVEAVKILYIYIYIILFYIAFGGRTIRIPRNATRVHGRQSLTGSDELQVFRVEYVRL